MSKVYGENFMSDGSVREWCRKFKEGRTDVHDEGGHGRKSVATVGLVECVDQVVRGKRRFTISELSEEFPEISRSALYTIVSKDLGYRKLCARWVPKMLSDDHKTQRMASALTFLTRYHNEGEDFFKFIVTGDETWVLYDNPETKEQSKQWMGGQRFAANDELQDAVKTYLSSLAGNFFAEGIEKKSEAKRS